MIATRLALVLVISTLVAAVHRIEPQYFRDLTPAPFTLMGLALSIFLGFRNNACYERWWEARRQWGQLVAEMRGLVRDAMVLLPPDPALHRRFTHRAIAFAHALRDQLRSVEGDTLRWLPPGEWGACPSRPDAIWLAHAAELGTLLRAGLLSDQLYRLFADRMMAATTIQTACERLRSTPTPFTYTLLLHRTAWLFCVLLPFGLVSTLGLATPVMSVLLAYAFFGLDALGEELEQPFGTSQNAIALDAMVRAIEIAALEALGETDLPQALMPREFVLL